MNEETNNAIETVNTEIGEAPTDAAESASLVPEVATEGEDQKEDLPIDQIKPVAGVVAALANSIEYIINKNYPALFSLVAELMTLSTVDWSKFMLQIKDVDTQERLELEGLFKAKSDLEHDKLELLIESGIDSLEKTGMAVESWISLADRVKAYKD